MATQLDGRTLAMLATDGFEQVEMTSPREALEDAGATVHLVAPQDGTIRGWDHTDWGESFDVDVTLSDARPEDYDGLVLPGGVLNPDQLRINDDAVAFARSFFENDKPVAAICHGAQTLIDAEVVEGRRMTSYKAIKKDLQNAGAHWVDDAAVVDGNLLTSRNPDDLPAFNQHAVDLFARTSTPEPVTG
jgi:protease I